MTYDLIVIGTGPGPGGYACAKRHVASSGF